VAELVDAVVDASQRTPPHPAADPLRGEAEAQELATRSDAVLPPRKPFEGMFIGSLSKYLSLSDQEVDSDGHLTRANPAQRSDAPNRTPSPPGGAAAGTPPSGGRRPRT
jgi:hypothetical protein